MYESAIIWDWVSFAVRWVHVITGIAWIGSSFFFIALDLGLRQRSNMPKGVSGEEWQVHGGGFYHIQKYLVAPENIPQHLIWHKWQSYFTWLSGVAMLFIVYYVGADLYLIDLSVMELTPNVAIAISVASIALGWIMYNLICKSRFGDDNRRLMIALYLILLGMAWGYTQVFSGRAAFLHLGAFTATIMTANVFLIIIPNQKIVVADLIAGRTPDPKYGKIAKQRSTHNNYLTLPVLFLMLSNHYPVAYATPYNWVIAALVFLMGVTIRHYFNSIHARVGNPRWTWAATAILFLAAVWLSTLSWPADETQGDAQLSPAQTKLVASSDFAAVRDTVSDYCSMCHTVEPYWDGVHSPPRNLVLETDAQIVRHARQIYLWAGRSHAMPPGNITFMEQRDRQIIVDWFEGVTRKDKS